MSKHTPAPWQYAFEGGTVAFIVEADGTTIAKISTTENSTAHRSLPSNARLIASAPELLEALKDLLRDLDTVDSYALNETILPIWEDIDRAKAIIAKAEGA